MFPKRRIAYADKYFCLASAMMIALCAGVGYSWSVFQNPLLLKFGWTAGAVSTIFTSQILSGTLLPPFVGQLQKKISLNNYLRIGAVIYCAGLVLTMYAKSLIGMYLCWGLITGLGNGMLYPSVMAYSGRLFPEKQGFSSGCIACAYGAGSMVWAPLAARIVVTNDVSAAFAVLGILYMIVILPMTFFIKEPPVYFSQTLARTRNGTNSAVDGAAHKDSSQSDYTAKQMLCSPVFYVLLLVLTFGASAGLMIMGHASSILQDRLNIDIVKAAFIIGFISMSNAAGRLLFGTISDKIGRMTILSVLFVIIMFSMAALIYADGIIFILAMMLTGSCYGGFASMFSPLTADFFGTKYLKINFAFMYIAYGLAGILGPQLAVSAKKSGGYNLAFVYVIALCAAGFCMSMGLSLYSKRTGNLRTRP